MRKLHKSTECDLRKSSRWLPVAERTKADFSLFCWARSAFGEGEKKAEPGNVFRCPKYKRVVRDREQVPARGLPPSIKEAKQRNPSEKHCCAETRGKKKKTDRVGFDFVEISKMAVAGGAGGDATFITAVRSKGPGNAQGATPVHVVDPEGLGRVRSVSTM